MKEACHSSSGIYPSGTYPANLVACDDGGFRGVTLALLIVWGSGRSSPGRLGLEGPLEGETTNTGLDFACVVQLLAVNESVHQVTVPQEADFQDGELHV